MSRILDLDEPGSQSIRRQLGIAAEDPRIFKPYTVSEAFSAARIMAEDQAISPEVRAMLAIGLPFDLMPAHLMPEVGYLATRLRCSSKRIRRMRLLWETVDPDIRFSIVRRACRMILAWRGSQSY